MSFTRKLGNRIGWKTKRKIVIIESDDWGSIRTASKEAHTRMLKAGLNVNSSQFTKYDALESNTDLENLFDLLLAFKDVTGRPPVLTPMCVVANPDFKLIEEKKFTEYIYEPLPKSLKHYPNHDRVIALWAKGIEERLFVPALHAREHLNVQRYMKGLRDKHNQGLKLAFDYSSIGASKFKGKPIIEYLGAFHPQSKEEIKTFRQIIADGCILFEEICGFRPKHFIPPNKETALELDGYLAEEGVNYITVSKLRKYPKGNGKYGYQLNWFGKKNKHGQYFILRNAFFEPASSQYIDWVSRCLTDIEQAFINNKPSIISMHRANFIGFIEQANADHGLKELSRLLKAILTEWPEVEFMTSTELGDLIAGRK